MNIVILEGYLEKTKMLVTDDYILFTGNLSLPVGCSDKFQNIRVKAWGDLAERLDNNVGRFMKVIGSMENGFYNAGCYSCGVSIKRYTTDVCISSFKIIN